ncbi:MAG: energy transducer TonB [bacterium]
MKCLLLFLIMGYLILGCGHKTKPEVFKHGDVVFERPVLLSKSDLIYPDSLKAKGIKGVVFIKCTIDTLGNVKSAEIFKTSDKRLNEAALKNVETYTFSPGIQNGERVDSNMLVTIKFK